MLASLPTRTNRNFTILIELNLSVCRFRKNCSANWRKASWSHLHRRKMNASSASMHAPRCKRRPVAIGSSAGGASSKRSRARWLSGCCRCDASSVGKLVTLHNMCPELHIRTQYLYKNQHTPAWKSFHHDRLMTFYR